MEKMRLSALGAQAIKAYEACRLTAYKPVASEKHYTIGYGHYGPDVKPGMKITESEADRLFLKDVRPVEVTLNALGVNFRQCQFDALASWIYNLGAANFKTSTLRKCILGDLSDVEITDQMIRWVNSNGKPLLGLKRRRVAEANMFLDRTLYTIDNNGNIQKRQ